METLSENRRARFYYDTSETFEAGISLRGFEVKSARLGRINLTGARAILQGGELWLIGSTIPAYQPKNAPVDFDPGRSRKLLLHKAELARLEGPLAEKKCMLIPLRAYLSHNVIKIQLGLGKPRKKHDKRELLKKRDVENMMRSEKF